MVASADVQLVYLSFLDRLLLNVSSISFQMSSTSPSQRVNDAAATTPPTTTTTLTRQVHRRGAAVENMIEQINAIIRRFLIETNHPSPYSSVFDWTVDEEPSLNYSVVLAIDEPAVER